MYIRAEIIDFQGKMGDAMLAAIVIVIGLILIVFNSKLERVRTQTSCKDLMRGS